MPPLENTDYPSDNDETVDPKAHKGLLNAVARLSKTQFIKKPSRSEPALKKKEFHRVGSKLGDADKYVPKLSKKQKKSIKVLEKPLENTVTDKIKRTIIYENAKKNFNRWNAVIEKNRATDHLVSIVGSKVLKLVFTLFVFNFSHFHCNKQAKT